MFLSMTDAFDVRTCALFGNAMKNATIKICWAVLLFVLFGCGVAWATTHGLTQEVGKNDRSAIFLYQGEILQVHQVNASDNPYIPCNASACDPCGSIRISHPAALNRLTFQNSGGFCQALFFTWAVPVQIPKKSTVSHFIFPAETLPLGRQISILNQSFLC